MLDYGVVDPGFSYKMLIGDVDLLRPLALHFSVAAYWGG